MSRITDWDTTPFINHVFAAGKGGCHSDVLDQVKEMHSKMRPSVDAHKKLLGKQDYCWNGEYRFWVWEGTDWRVFCSNIQGTSFEVREGITIERAFAAWEDYRVKTVLKVVGE